MSAKTSVCDYILFHERHDVQVSKINGSLAV